MATLNKEADKMKKYIKTNFPRLEEALPYHSMTAVTSHLLAREAINSGEKALIDRTMDGNDKCTKLFEILKKDYPKNYEILIEILKEDSCAAPEAVRILKEFYSSVASSTGTQPTSSSAEGEKLRHQCLTDSSINKISSKLTKDTVANSVVDQICNNLDLNFALMFPDRLRFVKTPYEIFFEILSQWRQSKPEEANLANLQAILRSMDLNKSANNIADCI